MIDELSVWKQGDQRAPHKPLLVLYALGRWQRGLPDVTFPEAEPVCIPPLLGPARLGKIERVAPFDSGGSEV